MNKLGFYLQRSKIEPPEIGDVGAAFKRVRPPVILVQTDGIDSDLLRRNRKPGGVNAFVVGRLFKTPGEQDNILGSADPAKEGRKFADEILAKDPFLYPEKVEMADGSRRLLIDAWMSLNEPIPGPNWEHFAQEQERLITRYAAYDRFQVAFRERLQQKGIEAVAFNFGAGNFSQAAHYLDHFPLTLAAYTYLGFHEYAWPHMNPAELDPQRPGKQTASSVGFYRRCLEGIRQDPRFGKRHQVIISEAGLTREHNHERNHADLDPRDRGEETRGWLCFTETLSQAYYFSSLKWYNDFLAEDEYVIGACLYQVGHTKSFISHRHLGEDGQGQKLHLIDWIADPESAPLAPQALEMMAMRAAPRPRRATIRGRIRAEGKSVAGATVRLIGSKASFARMRRAHANPERGEERVIEVTSGPRGHYRFADVPLDEYRLEVRAEGMMPFSTGFSCQGPMGVDLPLLPLSDLAPMQAQSLRHLLCGVNIDLRNEQGRPSAQQLKDLGATWVRFVFKQHNGESLQKVFDLYDPLVKQLHEQGIQILMVLNNESCPGWPSPEQFAHAGQWQRLRDEWHTPDENRRKQLRNEWADLVTRWQTSAKWAEYITAFAQQCAAVASHFASQVDAYQIWNEADHPGEPGYEPNCQPHNYAPLLKAAFSAIRQVSTAKVVTTGLVSGDPSYLDRLFQAGGNQLPADAVAVHPYAKKPRADLDDRFGNTGVQSDLLRTYVAKARGKGIWVTELGTHSGDPEVRRDFPRLAYAAIDQHLPDKVPVAFWFCWSNGMVRPHGLVEDVGQPTASFASFQGFALLALDGITPLATPAMG